MEEFEAFPSQRKHFYIASELIELGDEPICRVDGGGE